MIVLPYFIIKLILLKKNAIISIVSLLTVLVIFFFKIYKNVLTISLKFLLQENIIGTSLKAKVIVSITFYIKRMVFLKIFLS